ncbi:thioredoxin-like protein [Pisolithus albus]|nr:thioredoxin-like protein [Pisolithus albus]
MAANCIKNAQDFARIINSGRVVVIDFHADGSGMPQLAAQHFSTLEETWSRIGVDFYRVNVDELDEVAMEIDIRVVPTCVVFKDGKKVGYAGGVDAGNIHKLMGSHVGGWNNSGLASVVRTDSIVESA